jgi:hypothetical protein
MISVAITSDPPRGRVVRERDGADIGVTPLKESWPLNEGVEKLRIEMDGFKPERLVVPLDRGVDLAFTFTSVPTPESHRRKTREPSSKASPTSNKRTSPATPPPPPKPAVRPEPVSL